VEYVRDQKVLKISPETKVGNIHAIFLESVLCYKLISISQWDDCLPISATSRRQ
jgi:hypothetical protein